MNPTSEQLDALACFATGKDAVIEAGAGCGKTSVLRLFAYSTPRRGRYMAFNKSVTVDVAGKMPERCSVSTNHSLAFRAVGQPLAHRLSAPRVSNREIARALGLSPVTLRLEDGLRTLADGYLAGLVMRGVTRFCLSTDEAPSARHIPYVEGIDACDSAGKRTFDRNRALAASLEGGLRKAWMLAIQPDCAWPARHDYYFKLWALSHPRIPGEYLMLDEAQDTDAVLLGVFEEQDHLQRVAVGDANQQVYEWRGARDALARMTSGNRATLSQSFRFGPAIAEAANEVLALLDAPLRLSGLDSIESVVGPLGVRAPDAILCRTNARTIEHVLAAKSAGRSVHLVGGGKEVLAFANGADDLRRNGYSTHPDLAPFMSWGQVQEWVRQDPQGDELRLLVDLVDSYGVPTIRRALERMPPESEAELVVSTAHKGKGREWPTVVLADDFALEPTSAKYDPLRSPDEDPSAAELRLRYVAITRAQLHLDKTALDAPALPETPAEEVA